MLVKPGEDTNRGVTSSSLDGKATTDFCKHFAGHIPVASAGWDFQAASYLNYLARLSSVQRWCSSNKNQYQPMFLSPLVLREVMVLSEHQGRRICHCFINTASQTNRGLHIYYLSAAPEGQEDTLQIVFCVRPRAVKEEAVNHLCILPLQVQSGKWHKICPWSLKRKRTSQTLSSAVEMRVNKDGSWLSSQLRELSIWWAFTWSTTPARSGKLCTRKRSEDTMHTAMQNSKQWWRQGWRAWETKRN